MTVNTENLRLGIEHSRARSGLTEMVLTYDEVEELCDEIDRLKIEKRLAAESTATEVRFDGPAWLWGSMKITGSGKLVLGGGTLTIGPLPRWWQLRRWWKLLRQTTASYNKADKNSGAINMVSPVGLTAGAGES